MMLLSLLSAARCAGGKCLTAPTYPLKQSRASLGLFRLPFRSSMIRSLSTKVSKASKSAALKPTFPQPSKSMYPERFLAYHAGTGRTVFIGSMKLSSILVFVFFLLGVAPAYYVAHGEPLWTVPAAIAVGAVPMLFVGYTAAPFVTYVHLRLPAAARKSRKSLVQWASNIPAEAEIDLTTIRAYGQARQTRTRMSELRQKSTGNAADVTNLVMSRKSSAFKQERPWYMGKEQTRFYVGTGRNGSKDPAIWKIVAEKIRRA